MIPATRAFAAEIDAALDRLDVPALEREYWAQDEFLFIPRFLPPIAVRALLDDVKRLEPGLNRNYLPRHKKGGSVSHYAIAEEGPALLAFYRSERFRRFLGGLARADLKLCPDEDPHACALYFYTEPGDHMGYHYDTSYYRGARYTVLVGLVQDSASRLQCRLHTRTPGRAPVDVAVATEPGSLVVFNGDKVYHGVSPSQEGERRVVYTMEYVTSQEMGRVQRLYSTLKDAVAYFGIRALLRGRGRARDLRARVHAES
ncbi:MAG: 2OG-Fe(II) oxygenase [Candidatus Rokuibacteriota bacterium]